MAVQNPAGVGTGGSGGWVRLPETLRTINPAEALATSVATAISTGAVADPMPAWALTAIAVAALLSRRPARRA